MDNFYLMRRMLKGHLTQNFIPTKFKELLAEKHREGFLFHKIVTGRDDQSREFEVVGTSLECKNKTCC
jgi:hypothetical protein